MNWTKRAGKVFHQLCWKYFDDYIKDREFKLFEFRLKQNDEARHIYIDCAILHALLIEYFRDERIRLGLEKPRVRFVDDPLTRDLIEGESVSEPQPRSKSNGNGTHTHS